MTAAKLNLAPEVYQSGQRAKHRKQVATSIGIGVGVTAIGLVIACLVILGGQAAYIATLNRQIKDKQSQVSSFADLPKAVTLAQHLDSLNNMADQKVRITRFFDVLQTVVPQGLAVSALSINDANVLEVNATARSYSLATKFAKALEASNLEVGPNAAPSNPPYFTDVNLSAVSRNGGNGVDFKLTTQMAPEVTHGN
jgi:Tfp pilus assembly protein PilN